MKTEVFKIGGGELFAFDGALARAAEIIKRGGLVVFPTETVYGLGGDATNPESAKKIYSAKGRPSDNPLIIHLSKPEEAESYTYTSPLYYKLAESFMPGPLTVILPSKDTVAEETRAGLSTVAVRIPENPIARRLIELSGVPIAAPSANLSGSPSPTSAEHVISDMRGRVDMIIDGGDSAFGLESTIVKLEDDGTITLLRPGKITPEELSLFGNVKIADAVTAQLKEGEQVLSPGMKYRHYAPHSPLALFDGTLPEMIEYIKCDGEEGVAILSYVEDLAEIKKSLPLADLYVLGRRDALEEQAHRLFSCLRDADGKDYKQIYAPLPNTEGVGLALYNRLIRAAAHRIIKPEK
jgi:L-threonylcarbamoyladenylate synthase